MRINYNKIREKRKEEERALIKEIKRLRASGLTLKEIAPIVGLNSKQSVFNYLNKK